MALAGKELADRIVSLLEEKKGIQAVSLDVADRTPLADYFVIVSGRSSPHVKALWDNLYSSLKKEGLLPLRVEGERAMVWVLVDYGDVVVHVFDHEIRSHYDLEKLWGE